MYLYIQVDNNLISDIKYQSISDPASNVAIEVFCALVKGKILDEAVQLKEDAFLQFIGCEDEIMRGKTKSLLTFFNEGVQNYKAEIAQ